MKLTGNEIVKVSGIRKKKKQGEIKVEVRKQIKGGGMWCVELT